MIKYADVIVDISSENVDRPFEYIIPQELEGSVRCGSQVIIPFGAGSRKIKGVVINVKDVPSYDPEKLKSIDSLSADSKNIEADLVELAAFIKENYGSTMNRALKIVLPAKKKFAPATEKYISICADPDVTEKAIAKYSSDRRTAARYRLLTALKQEGTLPVSIGTDRMNISRAALKSMEAAGLIRTDVSENLRDIITIKDNKGYNILLNDAQRAVADSIWDRYENGDKRPSLIRGVTGSGKTEIYIDLISRMVDAGRQAIVLIPEIALTYQTVIRFYRKFGDRISVVNSRLSPAQKHDQLEKARQGKVDIIIGPRSALFAPFRNLGIVIIDEEHEGTYKNESAPKYHARDVAAKLVSMTGGILVMGSATPSIESYYLSKQKTFQLYELENRAKGAMMPDVRIIDMRKELSAGNRSIFSKELVLLMQERLKKNEQIMLFINRRAYHSFVSCRNCGNAVKCPHCDVSLKYHRNNTLMCHYCGYTVPMVQRCPLCGSGYIGTFGTGTQKVEEEAARMFPDSRILRMDMDTTKKKDSHEKILEAFANHEADILIGTQMIVKGHDFPDVTLMGILAADISLYTGGYMAAERTFQILTQAAGRAGRGKRKGDVVIQTYSPDNYAVLYGAQQDYKGFYDHEISYRNLLGYPPFSNMLEILAASEDEKALDEVCMLICTETDELISQGFAIERIGPSDAPVAKIQDKLRKIIYIRSARHEELVMVKDRTEKLMETHTGQQVVVTFDFTMRI